MRRKLPASRDDLDLATREAAEAAARRSGLSLDEWIVANLAQEQGQDRWSRASSLTADDQNRVLAALSDALATMTQRLDSIERKVATGPEPQPGRAVIAHPVERPERAEMRTRHRNVEAALARLRQQITADLLPPPSGRQDELLLSLRSDIANLSSQLDGTRSKAGPWAPAIASIRAEIERVQAAISGLATHDEVTTLERLIRHLADHLTHSGGGDAAAVAESLEGVRSKIDHLSDEMAADIHGRLASDIDGVMRKIDLVAASGLDRALAETLAHQVSEMRQALSDIAEPRSIERLAQEVAKLSLQLADLNSRQIAPQEFAALKAAIETMRSSIESTERQGNEVPHQLENLTRRLDVLLDRPAVPNFDSVTGQVEQIGRQLQDLMRRLPAGTDAVMAEIERLSGRVDRVDEVLRQADRTDQGAAEGILRAIQTKLDQFGASAAQLEALERTVIDLAGKLARNGSTDPALAALEHAMSDLVAQVEQLRENASTIAERAARAVLKEAQASGQKVPSGAAAIDMEALQRGFADLKAFQAAADRKTQQTLQAVHNALETLLMRAPAAPREGAGARQPRTASSPAPAGPRASPAVRMEAAVRKLHTAAMAQVTESPSPLAAGRTPVPSGSVPVDDVLLEPGTPRPPGAHRPVDFAPATAPDTSSVRANFIAAARRAAQAAASEKGTAPLDATPPTGERGDSGGAPAAEPTRLQRLRQALMAHRRPLLLSLTFVVLAVGALQIVTGFGGVAGNETELAMSTDQAAGRVPAPNAVATTVATLDPPESRRADSPDLGRTTDAWFQSANPSAPMLPSTAAFVGTREPVSRISDSALLGIVPSSLGPAALRQAALSGNPAALYEVASRAAEGRGMAQDAKLAARLFEKAAAAGLPPAQYRLGHAYDKGLGVPRDPAAAKAWYQRAAENGNVLAMHNLAVMLAQGADGRPDYTAAVFWFRQAAEFGIHDSQYNLAVLLARGLGTAQDLPQSFTWFAVVANQGDEDAAKKRDEVAARLRPDDLRSARAAAEHWRARIADQAANEVAVPSPGWTERAPEQSAARRA